MSVVVRRVGCGTWCGGWDSNPRRPTPRDDPPALRLGLECGARGQDATRPSGQKRLTWLWDPRVLWERAIWLLHLKACAYSKATSVS